MCDEALKVLGATPPTTRAEQLALKGKKRKNKKSKTGLTAKKKRGNKKALPSPSRRRRRLLRRKSKSSHSLSEKVIAADDAKPVEHALDVEAELKPKSTRGSKSRGPKASIKDASPADPESKVKPSKPEAAAKGKAKAKAKAKGAPKATAKATAKAKAKAAAKAKAKAKAKGAPKATAKAKAKAKGGPVDKKRGRSSAGSLDLVMPKDLEGWSDINMQVVLSAFAREWYDHKDDCMANFKLLMRDVLPPSQSHEVACLNIYWTRFSCGVTIKSTKKDFGSYHLPHKKAAPNLRLAVTIRCALLIATCLYIDSPFASLLLSICSKSMSCYS